MALSKSFTSNLSFSNVQYGENNYEILEVKYLENIFEESYPSPIVLCKCEV